LFDFDLCSPDPDQREAHYASLSRDLPPLKTDQ
jgi:hypothetical protein